MAKGWALWAVAVAALCAAAMASESSTSTYTPTVEPPVYHRYSVMLETEAQATDQVRAEHRERMNEGEKQKVNSMSVLVYGHALFKLLAVAGLSFILCQSRDTHSACSVSLYVFVLIGWVGRRASDRI